MRRILRTLLTTARRYGGPDLAIIVSFASADVVEIAVSDDGPPLDADVAQRVFERYYRERGAAGEPGSVTSKRSQPSCPFVRTA